MNKLHGLAGSDDVNRIADVIYLHGLNPFSGNSQKIAYETWGKNYVTRDFWPTWLQKDLGSHENGSLKVGVWLLEYDSAASAWLGDAMTSSSRAANIFAVLHSAGIGDRPLIFICHSLGGLTAKMLLKRGFSDNIKDWYPIAKSVVGVVFISTPHSGAAIASKAWCLRLILRANPTINDLQLDSEICAELTKWYRNSAAQYGIETLSFHETKSTLGARVVIPRSGDPAVSNTESYPVPYNHIAIAKLQSTDNEVYKTTLRFVRDCLSKFRNSTASKPQNSIISPETAVAIKYTTDEAVKVIERSSQGKIDREKLIQLLQGLTDSTFESVLLRLPGVKRYIPNNGDIIQRTSALIEYSESSVGPGLRVVAEALSAAVPNIPPDKSPFY